MKKKIIIIVSIIVILLSSLVLYSRFIATTNFETHEHSIKIENFPQYLNGFKIVHFTDLHYGRTIKKKELEKIVNNINMTKPDIVVFTGDLIDRDTILNEQDKEDVIKELKQIKSNLGNYIIKGNHDIKNKDWELIVNESNFIDLNNKNKELYSNGDNPIMVSGLSTHQDNTLTIEDKIKPLNEYINTMKIKPSYSILLIHEPDYLDKIDYNNYNLILAGHSHNGQIRLPIIGTTYLPEGAKKYYKEYYKLNNSDLYISNGLGVTKINFRFMNNPSINLFRLIKK